ncbi:MAG TPA: hypothetical protein VG457_17710 [Planctomycetota bacterium]|nr:hypothetical protein [Planctomycetota bacterium]
MKSSEDVAGCVDVRDDAVSGIQENRLNSVVRVGGRTRKTSTLTL